MGLKLISYGRVSTGFQDITIYMQQPRDFCKKHGHTLVGEFSDEDVSGGIAFKNRPEGKKAFEMLMSGKADGLIASETSRMFRDMEDGIITMNRLQEKGIFIFYCDQYTDEPVRIDTPAGFRAAITPLVDAHLERLKIKERTKNAMTYRRKNSMATSHTPFGLKRQGSGSKTLVEDPIEMPVVKWMLERRGSGARFSDIAEELNKLDVPTKKGTGPWYGKVVKGVLEFHSSRVSQIAG